MRVRSGAAILPPAGFLGMALAGLLAAGAHLVGLPGAAAQSASVLVDVDPLTAGAGAAYRIRWTPGSQGAQTITITFEVHSANGTYTTVPAMTVQHPSGGSAPSGFLLMQGGVTRSGWELTNSSDNRLILRAVGGNGLFLFSGQQVELAIPASAGLSNPAAAATHSVAVSSTLDGTVHAGGYGIGQAATATSGPSATPSSTPTSTQTSTPTASATPTATAAATSSPTNTATATHTPTLTPSPTQTPSPTATATRTATPTSTPTPLPGTPAAGQLRGTIGLRRAAQAPHASYVVDGTVYFYEADSVDGTRQVLASVTIRTDSSGAFLLDVPNGSLGALNGTFDVVVSVRGVLSRERDRVLLGPAVAATVGFGTMEPGDVDFDGEVDLADVILMKGAYGRRSGETGFSEHADADGDGVVTLLDLSLLTRSFGRRGPAVEP